MWIADVENPEALRDAIAGGKTDDVKQIFDRFRSGIDQVESIDDLDDSKATLLQRLKNALYGILSATDQSGRHALLAALRTGHTDICQLVLAAIDLLPLDQQQAIFQPTADINLNPVPGSNVLMAAVESTSFVVVNQLLANPVMKSLVPMMLVQQRREYGKHPLAIAIHRARAQPHKDTKAIADRLLQAVFGLDAGLRDRILHMRISDVDDPLSVNTLMLILKDTPSMLIRLLTSLRYSQPSLMTLLEQRDSEGHTALQKLFLNDSSGKFRESVEQQIQLLLEAMSHWTPEQAAVDILSQLDANPKFSYLLLGIEKYPKVLPTILSLLENSPDTLFNLLQQTDRQGADALAKLFDSSQPEPYLSSLLQAMVNLPKTRQTEWLERQFIQHPERDSRQYLRKALEISPAVAKLLLSLFGSNQQALFHLLFIEPGTDTQIQPFNALEQVLLSDQAAELAPVMLDHMAKLSPQQILTIIDNIDQILRNDPQNNFHAPINSLVRNAQRTIHQTELSEEASTFNWRQSDQLESILDSSGGLHLESVLQDLHLALWQDTSKLDDSEVPQYVQAMACLYRHMKRLTLGQQISLLMLDNHDRQRVFHYLLDQTIAKIPPEASSQLQNDLAVIIQQWYQQSEFVRDEQPLNLYIIQHSFGWALLTNVPWLEDVFLTIARILPENDQTKLFIQHDILAKAVKEGSDIWSYLKPLLDSWSAENLFNLIHKSHSGLLALRQRDKPAIFVAIRDELIQRIHKTFSSDQKAKMITRKGQYAETAIFDLLVLDSNLCQQFFTEETSAFEMISIVLLAYQRKDDRSLAFMARMFAQIKNCYARQSLSYSRHYYNNSFNDLDSRYVSFLSNHNKKMLAVFFPFILRDVLQEGEEEKRHSLINKLFTNVHINHYDSRGKQSSLSDFFMTLFGHHPDIIKQLIVSVDQLMQEGYGKMSFRKEMKHDNNGWFLNYDNGYVVKSGIFYFQHESLYRYFFGTSSSFFTTRNENYLIKQILAKDPTTIVILWALFVRFPKQLQDTFTSTCKDFLQAKWSDYRTATSNQCKDLLSHPDPAQIYAHIGELIDRLLIATELFLPLASTAEQANFAEQISPLINCFHDDYRAEDQITFPHPAERYQPKDAPRQYSELVADLWQVLACRHHTQQRILTDALWSMVLWINQQVASSGSIDWYAVSTFSSHCRTAATGAVFDPLALQREMNAFLAANQLPHQVSDLGQPICISSMESLLNWTQLMVDLSFCLGSICQFSQYSEAVQVSLRAREVLLAIKASFHTPSSSPAADWQTELQLFRQAIIEWKEWKKNPLHHHAENSAMINRVDAIIYWIESLYLSRALVRSVEANLIAHASLFDDRLPEPSAPEIPDSVEYDASLLPEAVGTSLSAASSAASADIPVATTFLPIQQWVRQTRASDELQPPQDINELWTAINHLIDYLAGGVDRIPASVCHDLTIWFSDFPQHKADIKSFFNAKSDPTDLTDVASAKALLHLLNVAFQNLTKNMIEKKYESGRNPSLSSQAKKSSWLVVKSLVTDWHDPEEKPDQDLMERLREILSNPNSYATQLRKKSTTGKLLELIELLLFKQLLEQNQSIVVYQVSTPTAPGQYLDEHNSAAEPSDYKMG